MQEYIELVDLKKSSAGSNEAEFQQETVPVDFQNNSATESEDLEQVAAPDATIGFQHATTHTKPLLTTPSKSNTRKKAASRNIDLPAPIESSDERTGRRALAVRGSINAHADEGTGLVSNRDTNKYRLKLWAQYGSPAIRAILQDPQLTRFGLPWFWYWCCCMPEEDRQAWKHYIFNGRSVLLRSESALRRARLLHYYIQAKTVVTDICWPIIVSSLIINDLVEFSRLPFNNSVGFTTQIIFGFNKNPFIFSAFPEYNAIQSAFIFLLPGLALYLAPAILGYLSILINRSFTSPAHPEELFNQLNTPDHLVWQDNFRWLLPCQSSRRALDRATFELLFNGNIQRYDRVNLLTHLISIADNHCQLAKIASLKSLSAIAESNIDHESQQRAMSVLRRASRVDLTTIRSWILSLPQVLTANYLLLSNGRSSDQYTGQPSRLHAVFAGIGLLLQSLAFSSIYLFQLFARYRIYRYLIESLLTIYSYDDEEEKCAAAGGQYLYIDAVDAFICSQCPDWPIYFGQMQDAQSCIDGLLGETRDITEINQFLSEVNGKIFVVESLDLSQQFVAEWPASAWGDFYAFFKNHTVQLQRLDLSFDLPANNTFSNLHIATLSDFLSSVSITNLTLSNRQLTTSQFNTIFSALANRKSIKNLNIRNTTLADEGLNTLISLINSSPLIDVNLADNQISDQGFLSIVQQVRGHRFDSFNLGNNLLTVTSVPNVGSFLSANSVQRLDLSGSNFQGADFSIINHDGKATVATTIILANCQIGDSATSSLSKPIQRGKLSGLDLSNNPYITDTSIKILVMALIDQPFTELRLANTQVTDSSLELLSLHLPSTRLSLIDISNLELSAKAFNQFASQLIGTKIVTLIATSNALGRQGLIGLRTLQTSGMSNLLELNVADNNFQDAEVADFITGLNRGHLEILNLAQNFLGQKTAQAFKLVLAHTSLTEINLAETEFDQDDLLTMTRELGGSGVRKIILDGNPVGGLATSELAAQLIAPSPNSDIIRVPSISMENKRIIKLATPRGAMTTLSLRGVNASTITVEAYCHVLFRTRINIAALDLSDNPGIDKEIIDPRRCRPIKKQSNITQFSSIAHYPQNPISFNQLPAISAPLQNPSTSTAIALGALVPILGLVIIIALLVRWWFKSTKPKPELHPQLSLSETKGHKLFDHNRHLPLLIEQEVSINKDALEKQQDSHELLENTSNSSVSMLSINCDRM